MSVKSMFSRDEPARLVGFRLEKYLDDLLEELSLSLRRCKQDLLREAVQDLLTSYSRLCNEDLEPAKEKWGL